MVTGVVYIMFNVLPVVCGSSMFVFVLLCIYFLSNLVCSHLEEEEKSGCFAIIVLQMNCYYKCSVALPDGAMGCSAVAYVIGIFPDHTHLL